MARVPYQVIPLDLSVVRSAPGVPIVPIGQPYDAVSILELPVGAVCSLSFGENMPQVPLSLDIKAFEFTDKCGNPFDNTEGLRFSNPAGAGIVTLLVSFGGLITD